MRFPRISLLLLIAALPFSSSAQADDADTYYADPLVLADIPRFDDLPIRLMLRPEFAEGEVEYFFDEELLPFFSRILSGDYQSEIHVQAAQSLERIGRDKLAPPEEWAGVL